jgi:hypothetical protein
MDHCPQGKDQAEITFYIPESLMVMVHLNGKVPYSMMCPFCPKMLKIV